MRKLASGVIGLLGLYVLATSPYTLSFAALLAASYLGSGPSWHHWLRLLAAGFIAVAPFVLAFGFGLAMVLWRERLAARLFNDSPLPADLDERALLTAAVRILGLWILVSAVTGLLNSAGSAVVTVVNALRGQASFRAAILGPQLASLAVSTITRVAEIVFGLLFVLRGKAVATWALGREGSDV
ncbi:MAG: hypothetical protein P4L93_03325 [Coriobacteriia bacterium]|nr:hypothetical protein [Coriobacteriia bacterium]